MLEDKNGTTGLENIGRKYLRTIHRHYSTGMLYEEAVRNREGMIAHLGPLVTRTGHFAELPTADRYVVLTREHRDSVKWSESLRGLSDEQFQNLFARLVSYMQNKEAYVQNFFATTHPDYKVPVRVVTEKAWHALYTRNMFIPVHDREVLDAFEPHFTIAHAPGFQAIPEVDGTRSSSFVIMHLSQRVIFIGGTAYAGELRNAVYSILNYLLPPEKVFPLRGSSNIGEKGDVALFMGRKGTGKTSLAVHPERRLFGDYGHGWTEEGLFRFGRGVYARVLDLDPETQPELHDCTRRFGAILENVFIDPETGRVDLADRSLTDNVRVAFPNSHLPAHTTDETTGHPQNIFLLTKDAYGVLPPIAKLAPEQAVYAFLSSYTSVFPETMGQPREPAPQFSTCFGTCPLSILPHEYAMMFMDRVRENRVTCWIMNTGWIGEPFGACERIPLAMSRSLADAALSGALDKVEFEEDPVFHFLIPKSCPDPDVPDDSLNPRNVCADPGEYEMRANRLAEEFMRDFSRFGEKMPENVRNMLSSVLLIDDMLDMSDMGFGL
ncbi:MAG: phosphoenolpyruvate carboxykinase (ATP) [Desulfatibacillaceae bacterium]